MTDYLDIIEREFLLCEIEGFIETATNADLEKIIKFIENLSNTVP